MRHVLWRIVDDGAMCLDIPDSDSEENDSDFDDEFDAPVPNPPPQNLRAPAPRATIPAIFPARSRNLWVGNDPKINLVASKFRGQPLRQELAANASGSQDLIAKIRSLKRDPTKEFDFGNLKHSGKKFLMEQTAAELNECAQFQLHMPAGAQLTPEYLRQKIKEFSDIAVATPVARLDIRN